MSPGTNEPGPLCQIDPIDPFWLCLTRPACQPASPARLCVQTCTQARMLGNWFSAHFLEHLIFVTMNEAHKAT